MVEMGQTAMSDSMQTGAQRGLQFVRSTDHQHTVFGCYRSLCIQLFPRDDNN